MINSLNRTSHFGEKEGLYAAVINKYRTNLERYLWKKVCDLVQEINVENPLPFCLLWGQCNASCRVEG